MTTDLRAWLDGVRQGVVAASVSADPFAHVHVLATTTSTNDDVARAAAAGAPEGYAVIAAEQTAGRGRRGAAWHSPAAHGLYCSMLLRPPRWPSVLSAPASPAPALATLMAGVAVAQAVRDACTAAVELKWPNDVVVREDTHGWRKLAGILAEGASDGGVLRTIVLGIGVNVRRAPAPADLAATMIALDELMTEPQPRAASGQRARPCTGGAEEPDGARVVPGLVASLLTRLRDGVVQLSSGALDEVRAGWSALAPSVHGTPVAWDSTTGRRHGVAQGIEDDGALRVALDDGTIACVHGGNVTWVFEGEPT